MGKKRKFSISKFIGLLLILVGLSTIGVVLYMNYKGTSENKAKISDFEQQLDNPTDEQTDEDYIVGDTIGILKIDKIDLKVAVTEGAELEDIKSTVGHFENTAMPGEVGNCSIAGHRSYTYSEHFNRLDEVEKGDTVEIKTLKGTFTYKINDIFIVDPKDVYVLDPTDTATITLITCTPKNTGKQRLILKGDLVQ